MFADALDIVHYCHRSCMPLRNIMRLPKEEAFALAYKMAAQNKETTAFYRFADFENYYPERLKTDRLLYTLFLGLGGKPVQEHPLSFVLQGSDYLEGWFDGGPIIRIPLSRVPPEDVSFTYGDSMSIQKKQGGLTLLTKGMLLQAISDYGGTLEEFMGHVESRCGYIEAQVWNDASLGLCPEKTPCA